MSRQYIPSEAGEIVVGWDEPFATFYAQWFKPGDNPRIASPIHAIGYHPDERLLDKDVPYDDLYPVATTDELISAMRAWGLPEDALEKALDALEGP